MYILDKQVALSLRLGFWWHLSGLFVLKVLAMTAAY